MNKLREILKNVTEKRILIALIVAVAIVVIAVIVGVMSGGSDSINEQAVEDTVLYEQTTAGSGETASYLTDNEMIQLFFTPGTFEGKAVQLSGMIYAEPQYEGDQVTLEIWNDPENAAKRFVVSLKNPTEQFASNQYVLVDGIVTGEAADDVSDESGNTSSNAAVTVSSTAVPKIEAKSVTLSSYQDVVAPTQKEVTFGTNIEQNGYQMTLDTIEFADSETRIYVTLKNNGAATLQLSASDATLVQNGTTYEQQSHVNSDYQLLPAELTSGAETTGVLVFPAMDDSIDFQLQFDVTSLDSSETLTPYQFNIHVNQDTSSTAENSASVANQTGAADDHTADSTTGLPGSSTTGGDDDLVTIP